MRPGRAELRMRVAQKEKYNYSNNEVLCVRYFFSPQLMLMTNSSTCYMIEQMIQQMQSISLIEIEICLYLEYF